MTSAEEGEGRFDISHNQWFKDMVVTSLIFFVCKMDDKCKHEDTCKENNSRFMVCVDCSHMFHKPAELLLYWCRGYTCPLNSYRERESAKHCKRKYRKLCVIITRVFRTFTNSNEMFRSLQSFLIKSYDKASIIRTFVIRTFRSSTNF